MKKLLTRFFQILCLIQLAGYGQLNAHPVHADRGVSYAVPIIHVSGSEYIRSVTVQIESAAAVKSCSTRPCKIEELITENIEEEYELISSRKQLESSHYFTVFFHAQLPDYLHHNIKNSLAFCKQASFILANRRYIAFQVFRI